MTAVASESRSTFGAKLRAFRDHAGLTQKELAEAVGLTAAAIARIESGTAAPSWETAVKIAAELERSLDEFLDREADDADHTSKPE